MPRIGKLVNDIFIHAILIFFAILFLIPLYLLFRNSLMTELEITAWDWVFWAKETQWQNYVELFSDPFVPMLNGFKNSTIIAVTTVVLQISLSCMAGYALARVPFKHKNIVLGFVLVTFLVPLQAMFVPQFVLVAKLGWVNTWQGLIIPGVFNAFNTFMFRQYFLNFPADLEDAGKVDGLGYFGIFWRLALPNAWPIIIALGSLTLVQSWNAFLWPLVIGQGREWWTVQVNISTFLTAQVVVLHSAFAAAFLGALPILLAFFVLQRYIAEGITRSGIKG